MKFYLNLYLCVALVQQLTVAIERNIICYYDASSTDRTGVGHFTLENLENALEFCTHIIYGYVGINSQSLQITSLNAYRDVEKRHFKEFTNLKDKYPNIKFILSLGGGRDIDQDLATNKYIKLLEANSQTQKSFIESVVNLLRSFKFDGLDLAFQFPQNNNNPKGNGDASWKLRNLLSKKLDETEAKGEGHKTQFSLLIQNLRKAFQPPDLLLSLTVLPNINASLYFNASALIQNLDFINLQTFDFTTPELNPTEATYTAPLYSLPVVGHRNLHHSVDHQVNYWLSQRISYNKLNVGIAAYGRAWKMTTSSKTNGYPKVLATNGPASTSSITKLPGVITWPEICTMLPNAFNSNTTSPHASLLNVLDPHKDFVTYAFRPADANGDYGIWISYDDPRIAAIKAAYVRRRHLGGVALYDVSLDDFHGICNGDTFPMLRYIKYTFL